MAHGKHEQNGKINTVHRKYEFVPSSLHRENRFELFAILLIEKKKLKFCCFCSKIWVRLRKAQIGFLCVVILFHVDWLRRIASILKHIQNRQTMTIRVYSNEPQILNKIVVKWKGYGKTNCFRHLSSPLPFHPSFTLCTNETMKTKAWRGYNSCHSYTACI